MNFSIREILTDHAKRLQAMLNLDISTARIEVQCLLQVVLQVNRAYLLTHPEQALTVEQQGSYLGLYERRLLGEPIAYLVGEREFFGLNFKVTSATLIPRPDTELLVELALKHIPLGGGCRVLDMGTGSGAIALSIAHVRPRAEVVAVDASKAALQVARDNQHSLQLDNVTFVESDWFSALGQQSFDVIVSNPPYIAANDRHLTQGDVCFEPISALVSGGDGLQDIRRISEQAAEYLNAQGWLMFEHGYNQAELVRDMLQKAGFQQVFSSRDLAGTERVTGGCT